MKREDEIEDEILSPLKKGAYYEFCLTSVVILSET